MQIFYSAKQNTFFNDVFHGTRTIQVSDPDWVRPTLMIPDPGWIQPSISVPNPAWGDVVAEGSDTPPETILVPDPDAVAPMIEVADGTATAPIISVPNPLCMLPPEDELMEVSEEVHAELFASISTGKFVLAADGLGKPVLVPEPGPTPEHLKANELYFRDATLVKTDPLVSRHRDEVEFGDGTTLTASQYKELQVYRQELRVWPNSKYFPDTTKRPTVPSWLV